MFQKSSKSNPLIMAIFRHIFKYIWICLLFLCSCRPEVKDDINKNDFITPSSTVKIHTWWHWIDGAITKDGITKDLEAMHQQGISQATILNVGLFGGRNFGVPKVIFNTPQWYEMFRWALHEADRLGIKIGVHNCDGWSASGGPWITPEMSMKQYVWTKTIIEGGKPISLKLRQPMAKLNFYKDVAVVAFKTNSTNNSYQAAKPRVTVNDSIDGGLLSDGDPVSGNNMHRGDFIIMSFSNVFDAKRIAIYVRRPFMWRNMAIFNSEFELLVSNDGKNFKKVQDIEIIGLNKLEIIPTPELKSKYYKLQLRDFSNVDPQYEFTLSEMELLGAADKSTFSSDIPFCLEKTVSIKTVDKSSFDATGNSSAENLIKAETDVIDLTKNLSNDGTLNWEAPAGNWCIIRFGYTTTGKRNEPATAEGTGLECDKMDTSAVGIHFRNYPQKLINEADKYSGNTFKFMLIDSWECNYQNWTTNFASEFEKQQGYSLIKWIPALCGETVGNSLLTEGFLYDFRKTIANLIENNYYKYFSELCHKQKLELHAEVIYGDATNPPIDVLKSNTYADLPMWEFWAGPPPAKNFPEPYVPQPRVKGNLPVYAANCYQLPIVAAEAYTSWAHYSESPFYLKPFGDRAFCQGINQLILHSYVHQPTDSVPGLTLGKFGSHFNRLNTWWSMASDWFTYQNRVQYILQKGETFSDVLYFLGDQLPQFIANNTINQLPYGYRASACNPDILLNKTKIKNGKILLSKSQVYSILILPESRLMELASLRRIAELVDEGAIVFGSKPLNQLSLKGRKDGGIEFKEIADKLWGKHENQNFGERIFGKGKIIWGKPIEKVLQQIKLAPDLSTDQSDSLNIQFIHKKIGETDVYFVANQQNTELKRELIFRISGKIPEIWNPEYGIVQKVTNYSNENNQVRIPVTLSPYESLFIVFNGKDKYHKLNQSKVALPEIAEISNFTGTITFSPAYPANFTPVEITGLKSWTDFSDPAIKYFSGKARYKIHFTLPAGFKPGTDSVLLSLGKIGCIARVRLNNKELRNIWIPDFRMDVSNILQSENELEVEVANVYRNRIIGDLTEFGKLNTLWTTSPVETYFETDKTLQPSGLMGPIELIKYRKNREVSKN
jgi:hypothetical protein